MRGASSLLPAVMPGVFTKIFNGSTEFCDSCGVEDKTSRESKVKTSRYCIKVNYAIGRYSESVSLCRLHLSFSSRLIYEKSRPTFSRKLWATGLLIFKINFTT